jgi:hypothetical protein
MMQLMVTQKSMLFFLLLLFVQVSQASEKQAYILQKLTQLPVLSQAEGQWLNLTEQPNNKGSFYVANSQGKIYQFGVSDLAETSLLLDLKRLTLPVEIHKLGAFTLHPNFSKRGSSGFGKFYTAHVENFSVDTKTKRIADSHVDIPLPFDAVLTQWQVDLTNNLDPSSRLEIVRIAIPDKNNGFRQLSFNPHSKFWHDDFAQLYLSLSQSQSLKEYPIYSGAIFRIQPPSKVLKKKRYSIPKTNPYFANNEIEDALYIFGAGKIKQFDWPNKHSSKLLISHQYPFNYSITNWLSLSKGGEDWRKTAPLVPLYKSTESIAAHGLLSYSGQNVPILRKKLLMLIQSNQQWQLSSIPLEYVIPSNDEPTTAIIPDQTVEWSLELKTPSTNQLGIYQDDFGEILVFNKVTGIIYQVFQHEIHTESSSLISIQQPLLIKLVVGFFIFVVLGIAIKLIKQQISAKNIARKDFAKITLADDKNNIELFRRHVKVPSIIIPIREVDQYQVCLGQEVLSTINRQPNKGFNSKQEERLRELFRIEQIAKMVDGKIRRISIVFTNKHNSKFTVCLYFRQGSERITKKNYFDVVDDIIQWCWLLAEKLNPSQTGSKPINDVGNKNSSNLTEHNSIDNSPLHAQAAIIRPATHPQSNKNYHPRQVKQNVTTAEPIEQSNSKNKKIAQPHTQETDVVNALEKLVTLQQQGFLTALEFKQAKAKLLDGFTSKIT